MNRPRISVVLPTLNRSDKLRRSATSVLAQSYGDFELLIVDDGSEEDISSVVASFNDPRARCIRRPQRGGPAAARNTGIAAAKGDFIAFQDSDDEWLLNRLELMLAIMQDRPDTDLLYCDILRVGQRGLKPVDAGTGVQDLSHTDILARPGGSHVYTQCWLLKRELVTQRDGFDEALFLWDDWELLIRLSQHHQIRRFAEPLVISEWSDDSITGQSERWPKSLAYILNKHAQHLAQHPRAHAFLQTILARHLSRMGQRGDGLLAVIKAIRLRPGHWQPWAVLIALLLGRNLPTHLMRWRRQMNT